MLIAKLSTGEMAYYDVWHGGFTKNPWNLLEGASGSSAGGLLHCHVCLWASAEHSPAGVFSLHC